MPIFRILNLGNEVPNLVFEFQNALVFLGLRFAGVKFFVSLKIASSNDISVLFLSMSCKCCMPRSGKTRVPHTKKA